MKDINRFFTQQILFAFFSIVILANISYSATYTVTNTANGGSGSLRQAIVDANKSSEDDIIEFDATTFSTPQIITLTDGQISIFNNGTFTINGPGNNLLTVSGDNNSRIFGVIQQANVAINDLTVSNGNGIGNGVSSGGAIHNSGTLTITNVVVSNNVAAGGSGGGGIANNWKLFVNNSKIENNTASSIGGGGILNNGNREITINDSIVQNNTGVSGAGLLNSNGGKLILNNTTVSDNNSLSGNGGGINNGGPLTITNSKIINNTAGFNGGGIMIGSSAFFTVVITDSTISNNSAVNRGGGILIGSNTVRMMNSTIDGNTAVDGGGIYHSFAGATIMNSTVSNNTATGENVGGGITASSGTLNLTNLTIALNMAPSNNTGNGGGVKNGGSTVNSRNTIVAKNQVGNLLAGVDFSGILTSKGNNLLGDTTSTVIAGDETSNLLNVDPLLDTLNDNGGSTRTHALQSDSPAINVGNNCILVVDGCETGDLPTALDIDQRGMARPQNGIVDIGAFEFNITLRTNFDFDGDGKSDPSVYRDGMWYMLRSTQGDTASPFGLAGDVPTSADFDGDGKTDIAVWRAHPTQSNFYILESSTNTLKIEGFGIDGDDPTVVGDYDGDGKADVAVYRDASVGQQSYFYFRGSLDNPGGDITFTPWGTQNDKPAIGDYDGDGKVDFAVFRPSEGLWYILDNATHIWRVEQFGLSTDKIVQADYDGDAKTDIAVFRPSTGVWYIKKSSVEPTSPDAIQYERWGLGSDTLVPADYDGDGKVDVAVWRDGYWYYKQSSDGSANLRTRYGISTDKPIQSFMVH